MCNFCRNAFCDPTLDHDNDLSYFHIGDHDDGYCMSIRSGDMRPVAIVFTDTTCRSSGYCQDVGYYYPKFCPECGRKITERDSLLKLDSLIDQLGSLIDR